MTLHRQWSQIRDCSVNFSGFIFSHWDQAFFSQVTVFASSIFASELCEIGFDAWDDAVDINAIGIPPGLPWEQIETIIRVAAPVR